MAGDIEEDHISDDEILTVNQGVEAVLAGIRPKLQDVFKQTNPDHWENVVAELKQELLKVLEGQLSLDGQLNMEYLYVGTTQVKASLLKLFEDPIKREFLFTLPRMRLILLDLIAADPEGIRSDLLLELFKSRMSFIKPNIEYTEVHLNVLLWRLRKALEKMNMKIEARGRAPANYRLVVQAEECST